MNGKNDPTIVTDTLLPTTIISATSHTPLTSSAIPFAQSNTAVVNISVKREQQQTVKCEPVSQHDTNLPRASGWPDPSILPDKQETVMESMNEIDELKKSSAADESYVKPEVENRNIQVNDDLKSNVDIKNGGLHIIDLDSNLTEENQAKVDISSNDDIKSNVDIKNGGIPIIDVDSDLTEENQKKVDISSLDPVKQAAHKRWKSRVTLITKALSAWSPSPQLPLSAAGGGSPSCQFSHSQSLLSSSPIQPQSSSDAPSSQGAVTYDPDQQAAIEAARSGQSFFLTGSAGTGKSFVLKRIIKDLRQRRLTVAVTASTGCAAVAIQGCTVHSACGVGIGMDSIQVLRKKALTRSIQRKLLAPDVLIIDEVSMLDSILFDKIEAMYTSARSHLPSNSPKALKKRKLSANSGSTFGGLQVIVCGDFFQLPPVSASDPKLQHSQQKFFAFDSNAWKEAISKTIILRHVHRQADRNFVGLLNELRYGIVSHFTMRVLSACRSVGNVDEVDDSGECVHYTQLFTYRQQVDHENEKRLLNLPGKSIAFCSKKKIDRSQLGGIPISSIEGLIKSSQAPERLVLKIGARVLCVKNIDQEVGIVNGSAGTVVGFTLPKDELAERRLNKRGKLNGTGKELINAEIKSKSEKEQAEDFYGKIETKEALTSLNAISADNVYTMDGLMRDEVIHLDDESLKPIYRKCPQGIDGIKEMDCDFGDAIPVVKFDNGIIRTMYSESWSICGVHGKEVAERRQIPLVLGWALTIHKAQGTTLEFVETDVGRAFDFGQVYVAMSRAKSMQGLRLTTFNAGKVMTHVKVRQFYEEQARHHEADIQ